MNEVDPLATEPGARPSAWLWHVYLFFRPRTFFRAFAARPNRMLTAGCAWLFGVSHAIEWVEQKSLGYTPMPWIDDWNTHWVFLLLAGAFSGVLYFFIGGWWYRLRIRWSGAPAPDAALAKRVYLFSSQVHALPTLVVTLIESSAFQTPAAALYYSDGSLWYLLLLVFPFWSVACSYLGVRTMFEVDRRPAVVWFLVLPSIVYALALAAGIALFLFPQLQDAEPDLERTREYRSEALTFSYPGNWRIESEESEGESEFVALEGIPDAYLRLMTYPSLDSPEQEVSYSLAPFAEKAEWRPGEPFDAWGTFEGVGGTGTYVEDGTTVHVRIFATWREDRLLESQLFYAEDAAEDALPVLDLVGRTVTFR